MSYAISGSLQAAVYTALAQDDVLMAIVGDAIYDAMPPGEVPPIYVRLGAETVRDASDGTGAGAEHSFTVSVVSDAPGYADAKAAAGAISDALHDADLTLSRGRLVSLRFERASARTVSAAQIRQIDLRFRARVEDAVAL